MKILKEEKNFFFINWFLIFCGCILHQSERLKLRNRGLGLRLRYKKNFDFSPQTEAELKICAELSAQLDTRMELLRQKIIGD